jgi:hypothetical protein
VKRRLCDLDRGTLFRASDGLLWRPGYPATGATRWAHAVDRPQDSRGLPADAEVEVVDPDAVLARAALLERENAELRAVLHDLWQDRDGAAAGAAAERGEVLGLFQTYLEGSGVHCRKLVREWQETVEARGPWHPPVPPCALEGVLRETVEFLADLSDVLDIEGTNATRDRIADMLARLRAALGEG